MLAKNSGSNRASRKALEAQRLRLPTSPLNDGVTGWRTKVSGTLTRERVITSAEESLQRLGVDVIDLFQLHVFDDSTPVDETLAALDTLVEQGKVKHIGCSNWGAWQMAHALVRSASEGGPRMESVQPPYNLVQREIEADLLPLCRDQQVGVLSYSPLGAGFLTGKYRVGQDIPSGTRIDVMPGHQPIYFHDTGWAALGRLDAAAAETGRSLVDLALSWVLAQDGVTSVLSGCRKLSRVDQAFEGRKTRLGRSFPVAAGRVVLLVNRLKPFERALHPRRRRGPTCAARRVGGSAPAPRAPRPRAPAVPRRRPRAPAAPKSKRKK